MASRAAPRVVSAAEIAAKLTTGDVSQTIAFQPTDFILYALSVGCEDVIRKESPDLPFVWEEYHRTTESPQLNDGPTKFSILPTFFTTPSFRTTWRRGAYKLPPIKVVPTLVHLSQRLVFHGPLPEPIVTPKRPFNGGAFPHPAQNVFMSTSKLLDVTEREGGKGLVNATRCDTWEVNPDGTQGRLICSNYATGMVGAPGLEGVGRKLPPSNNPDPLSRIEGDLILKDYQLLGIPTHLEPTHTLYFQTHPFQAALHRLVAHDDNPIHISPSGSIQAGFPGPILHGLGTFGIMGKLVTDACANGNGNRMRSLNTRFAGVVIPGEKLLIRVWDPSVDGGKPKVRSGAPPSSYKPGAKQYRKTVGDTGKTVKIVVFEAFVVTPDGKERAVIKDGQAEFWEDSDAIGAKL